MTSVKGRTCVGCGQTSTKGDLVRFVRDAAQQVSCDPSGRKPGRGAYLCPNKACFEAACKRHALARALRVKIDEETMERLGQEFEPLCLGHSAM